MNKMQESKMGVSLNNLVNENNGKGNKTPQYVAALSVCLGSVACGTVLGWTANISDNLRKGELNNIIINDEMLGWIGSFATLGAMIMCSPIGLFCDLIGRKWAMLSLIVPFEIGWLLIIFSNSISMIYAGRFLTGMAGGAFCVSAPLYTSEIAQTEIRGALGSYFQLLLTVGILLSYILGASLSIKIFTIICALIPLIFGIAFFLQPETPVYSLQKNDEDAARLALRKLRGDDYNIEEEMADIKKTIENNRAIKVSFMESIKKTATKKSLLICFGLMFFQQLSGVNAVIFYTDTIFRSAGSSLKSTYATIIVGIMQTIATFISSLIIDRFGRKILLITSDFLMAISGFVLGLFFTLKDRHVIDQDTATSIGFIPIVALCIFMITFSLGIGPIPWMISSEVFPAEIKSNASSAAGTFNWFLAFIVTKFYLNLKTNVGGDSTFYIFSIICLLGSVFIFFVCPETKGKTLDQIQRELNNEPISNESGIDNKAFSK